MVSLEQLVLLALSDKLATYDMIYKIGFSMSYGSIRVILNRLRERGYVEKVTKNGKAYVRLTSYGTHKVKDRFFGNQVRERWDGKWRVVIEGRRVNLKKNGFGMLRRGIYISPFSVNPPAPPLAGQAGGLILETRRIGSLRDSDVVAIAWQLPSLAARLGAWITKATSFSAKGGPASGGRDTTRELILLISQYQRLVEDTPRLPRKLFPPNWPGSRAEKTFLHLIRKYFSKA